MENPSLEGQLNKLGKDGWELVSVSNAEANGNNGGGNYYFKRPLAQ
jgi:hypothetical protein